MKGEDRLPRRRPHIVPVKENDIGRRLKQFRIQLGMTQVEVAEALGIEQSLVSDYERGILRLHGALVAGFAKVLRVTSDEILGLQKTNGNRLVKDRRFLRRLQKIDKLSARQKQALLTTIDTFLKGAGVD